MDVQRGVALNALIEHLDLGSGDSRVVVKDCIDVAGTVTTLGVEALADSAPAVKHAKVVDRILGAGFRILGKANMHPLAYGVTGRNDWAGTPINPYYPDRICGGSSSGSAVAVAAGLADIALGTDTGGSVRMPAACCGVIGLKPEFGLIDREGVWPKDSSLDCVGVMANSVERIERAMEALVGNFRPRDDITKIRLGAVRTRCDDEVLDALQLAFATSDLPSDRAELPLLEEAHRAGLTIIGRECWNAYGHLADHPLLPEDIAIRLHEASVIGDSEVLAADAVRTEFRAAVDRCLDAMTVLVLPAMPSPAPLIANAHNPADAVDQTRLLRPFNLSGHPALTIPLETISGAPFGMQLVARNGDEALLCAVARRLEPICRSVDHEELLI